MSKLSRAKFSLAFAIAASIWAVPGPASASAAPTQGSSGILALATVYAAQPIFNTTAAQSGTTAGSPLSNAQRWYLSFLTQQRSIACQVSELTERLHRNLIGSEEYLDRLDPLLLRADRLYSQWKTIGSRQAERLASQESASSAPARIPPVLASRVGLPAPGWSPEGEVRDDAAVGKCLNYLRLSIVNLFLGYADSNGRQIQDAERQAGLSDVWRSRSLTFIRALER